MKRLEIFKIIFCVARQFSLSAIVLSSHAKSLMLTRLDVKHFSSMPINTPLINIYEVIIKAIESRKYARRLSIQDHTERENLSMVITVNLSPEQAAADERNERRNLKVHLTR